MLKLSIYICVITQFCSNCPVYCEENSDSSFLVKDKENEIDLNSMDDSFDETINENDPTNMENFIDPHSLFYDRHSKKVIDDIEPLPRKQDKGTLVLRKSSEDCDTLKVYYKRLILMLLSNANLQTKGDSVEGQLFIKGTYDQIEMLKKLDTEYYSLKEIDLILSKIISKASYYNYFIHVPTLSEIIFSLSYLWNYVEVIVITITILAIIMLSRITSLRHAVILILVTLFIVSFYMTWWHLIKEAEIKLAVTQVKYIEMPLACQPHKMNFWDTLKSYIFDNEECEKYVASKMRDPKLQVTPALVLSQMFATVTLQPFALVGETISKFINASTAHLNWLRGPVQILLYICLPAFFMILVFAFRGGSVNLGLGPLFRFSFATHGPTSIPNSDKRQTIELIREVLAEVPSNATLSITESTKSMSLPITNIIEEDNSSTDNLHKDHPTESISKVSKKEQICACGDSVKNNLLLEERNKISKECVEAIETDTEKHIGSGDA